MTSYPDRKLIIATLMKIYQYHSIWKNGSVRCTEDKYLVQTRSQSKLCSIKLPEVHRGKKGIDPHLQPERQTIKPTKESTEVSTSIKKPRL